MSLAARLYGGVRSGEACSFDDCLGEGLRGFVRKIVADAARDEAVLVFAREFLGIGGRIRVWCPIGITFKGDGGYGNDRKVGKPLVQICISRLALRQVQPPAVVMDHDSDMIRILEGGGA